MRLTCGERFAIVCFILVLIGFMPPVYLWAAAHDGSVMGLPFPLFWSALMVLCTSVLMISALFIKNRIDRR